MICASRAVRILPNIHYLTGQTLSLRPSVKLVRCGARGRYSRAIAPVCWMTFLPSFLGRLLTVPPYPRCVCGIAPIV